MSQIFWFFLKWRKYWLKYCWLRVSFSWNLLISQFLSCFIIINAGHWWKFFLKNIRGFCLWYKSIVKKSEWYWRPTCSAIAKWNPGGNFHWQPKFFNYSVWLNSLTFDFFIQIVIKVSKINKYISLIGKKKCGQGQFSLIF